ncbi:MAG: hypothetical protein KF754_14950 [Planctomycetes bacterium]|nr:hypothetical protein [Planctomycetota bacterium]
MNHPELHDLTALAYNMVEGPERERLLEHVNLCDSCRELYDSYLEEQALVRDVLYRDARSGPAEARALEKTLRALADADTQAAPVQGAKIFRLVTWKVVAQAAAVLVVALALLVILKPDPKPENEILAIAPAQAAPGKVVGGELLVPALGQWQRADAVPADEWVLSGKGTPLVIDFPGGATATMQPGAVFRIAMNDGPGGPVLTMLHGNGAFVAGQQPDVYCLRWRDGEFVPMAGTSIAFEASYADDWRPDAGAVRGWMAARHMNVQVTQGKGLYLPSARDVLPGVLVTGEDLQAAADRARVRKAGMPMVELHLEADSRPDMEPIFAELKLRLGEIRTGSSEVDQLLRRRMEEAQHWAFAANGNPRQVQVVIRRTGEAGRTARAMVSDGDLRMTLERLDDDQWAAIVQQGDARPTTHAGDAQTLRNALSEDARRLFDEAVASLNQKK